MRRTRHARGLWVVAALALALAACTDSDGGEAATDATSTTTVDAEGDPFTESDVDDGANGDESAPADDGFDPDVVDEALEPDVVDEVVLDDDVIIATDDGQIPTTTAVDGAGDSTPDTTSPVPSDEPVTTPAPAPVPEAEAIGRVVSLSATHTETIGALGAADLLVGIDAFSDAPAGAPIEFDQFVADDLDPTQLRSLGVDLVVLGDDPGDIGASVLAESGIPFFDGARPSDRAGVEQQILDLASSLGLDDAGRALVATMRTDIDAVLGSLPTTNDLTYFHEIDPGYATYAPGTLIDALYGELGLTSIVGPAAESTVFVSPDDVLDGDPDVVVLGDIDCCAATADRAANRSGWSDLAAVRNGAVVEVPDDIANRFGVNIVELMRLVATGVAAAA